MQELQWISHKTLLTQPIYDLTTNSENKPLLFVLRTVCQKNSSCETISELYFSLVSLTNEFHDNYSADSCHNYKLTHLATSISQTVTAFSFPAPCPSTLKLNDTQIPNSDCRQQMLQLFENKQKPHLQSIFITAVQFS